METIYCLLRGGRGKDSLVGDRIQLHGSTDDYELSDFTQGSVSGVAISLQDSNDLIGAVVGLSTSELNLNNSAAFQFVG